MRKTNKIDISKNKVKVYGPKVVAILFFLNVSADGAITSRMMTKTFAEAWFVFRSNQVFHFDSVVLWYYQVIHILYYTINLQHI